MRLEPGRLLEQSASHPAENRCIVFTMTTPWPTPSTAVRELIRRGAEIMLDPSADWLEELYTTTLARLRAHAPVDDPALAASMRTGSAAILRDWAEFNVRDPGRRVPPNLAPETLHIARDLARRGMDPGALDAYRLGQSVAWRRWMRLCFDLTSDRAELAELLDVSERSISAYIDDTIDAIGQQLDRERVRLGGAVDRLSAVTLLLEGAPIHRARAEMQLGYGLTGPHTAAIVWSSTGTDAGALESVAEALTRVSDAARRLTIVAGSAALWVWLPVDTAVTTEQVTERLDPDTDVHVAIGRPGRDLDGFRRSHLDALTAQRMLARLTSPQRVAHFDDVALVALMTGDPTRADEFVRDTLGALLHADPETRRTLTTYLREQCNTSRTAERLFTHRNTVIRRLDQAKALLPRPLATNPIAVAAALEVMHWRGTPPGEPKEPPR